MKRHTWFVFVAIIGLLFSCSDQQSSNNQTTTTKTTATRVSNSNVLVDTVKYLVKLSNNGEDRPPFYTHSQMFVFLQELIDSVKHGQLKAFDSFDNHLLSTDEIASALNENPDTITVEDPETGNMIEKITQDTFDINDIQEIYFYERWTYNPQSLQISKSVFAIAPVIYTATADTTDHSVRRRLPFIIQF